MRQAWLARGPVPTPHGTRLLVFGSGAFLHTADFGRVIPKAMPRAKPGLTHRRSKAKWPQWWRTPGDTRSTSAHPTVRAGLVATLPSITESIAQHSSLGPRSPGNYSAGLPANTVTSFEVLWGSFSFLSKAFKFRLCTNLKSCSKATESRPDFHQTQVKVQPLLKVHGKGS